MVENICETHFIHIFWIVSAYRFLGYSQGFLCFFLMKSIFLAKRYTFAYAYGKQLIWAILNQLYCILRRVRSWLANCTYISPTSETVPYTLFTSFTKRSLTPVLDPFPICRTISYIMMRALPAEGNTHSHLLSRCPCVPAIDKRWSRPWLGIGEVRGDQDVCLMRLYWVEGVRSRLSDEALSAWRAPGALEEPDQ